jgi:transposase
MGDGVSSNEGDREKSMVWLARTGSPGRDLPSEYGPWKTVASRFYRWRRDGIFDRVLAKVHRRADACGELDWLCRDIDGSVIGGHQHAAHRPLSSWSTSTCSLRSDSVMVRSSATTCLRTRTRSYGTTRSPMTGSSRWRISSS